MKNIQQNLSTFVENFAINHAKNDDKCGASCLLYHTGYSPEDRFLHLDSSYDVIVISVYNFTSKMWYNLRTNECAMHVLLIMSSYFIGMCGYWRVRSTPPRKWAKLFHFIFFWYNQLFQSLVYIALDTNVYILMAL